MYRLIEIGYDNSIETEESLIEVAKYHCNSYPERDNISINNLDDAINYFNKHGFKVEKLKESQKQTI